MELLPGLPKDVALECLVRIPFQHFSKAIAVCRGWKSEIELPEFRIHRKEAGQSRSVIVVSQARFDPIRNSRAAKLTAPLFYRLVVCDPKTGQWSELPPLPEFPDGLPVFCQVVGVGSDLVVMGGCDPVTWQVSNLIFVYNFISGTWRRGADMPGARRLFFACASDSHRTVYVAGGHDEVKNALQSAMTYDVADDRWFPLPDMAKGRDECKGIFHSGKFHVISGYATEMQGRFERDAESFDPVTWQWDPVQEGFLDTSGCPKTCMDGCDGRVYMCLNGNVMAREGATWQVVAGLPAEVSSAGCVTTWQGKLLVIGCEKFGEPHRAYVLDLQSQKWEKLELPEEHSGHVQSGCCLEI
ncbi:hypothetical protein NMG60_11002626 [Bertholletia excelsa]